MTPLKLVKIAHLKSTEAFRARLAELECDLPLDDRILTAETGSPLAWPLRIGPRTVGNRWCIHPMEGWDGQPDGNPSELTIRRWQNFGRSGAKLIWGGEAVAVQADGRANPRQLLATAANQAGLAALRGALADAHRGRFGTTDDLLIGLQLTHSGRFSRPHDRRLEPRIAYHHPWLDARCGVDPQDARPLWTDDALDALQQQYVAAAGRAREAGFDFVDIKACHGYLLHELLSARLRPGRYGGDYEGRTRFLKSTIASVQQAYPDLLVGVRLSVFDTPPYCQGPDGGVPEDYTGQLPYVCGFGLDANHPLQYDLEEPIRLLRELQELGVVAVNLTCGSPYYNPHVQRPAMFPPSDGYGPPEDPLVGVFRLISAARRCKQAVPDLPMVGTGYTYLQDYLPHVAQAVVRAGWIDVVGLGRMVLAYPELPEDSLTVGQLDRARICRTFSDCTTAPRNGLVSGCYPLDACYKQLPEAARMKELKRKRQRSP